jgi:N-acetyl-gamma-glutamyl-phosphate reductase
MIKKPLYFYSDGRIIIRILFFKLMEVERMRACIIGATGYGGAELIRFLLHHPHVQLTSVVSSSNGGIPLPESFPHLLNLIDHTLDDVDMDVIRSKADVVFTATPSGVSMKLVPLLLEAGLRVIDLSGDYRLKSPSEYTLWYGKEPAEQGHLDSAVYGLSECFAPLIAGARFISNPGCYPTATLLGLAPLVQSGWIDPETIIIDAKSGVSGAGRGVGIGTHYSELNENLKVYKVNKHQHIPEIEQALSWIGGQPVVTTFTTHLVPMTRGIMATMYAKLTAETSTEELLEVFRSYYEGKPFVRIRPEGQYPATKEVFGSNYCDIGLSVDQRTGRVTVISVIDNVVKGAAGQAIQNLNISMGWEETAGLHFAPVYP